MNSVLSLDLGGKNTGFFSFTNSIDNFQSGTIIYDENFVLSQVNRRGKRHTKRNNLRNKLAKRLFLLILQKHFNINLTFLPDEISGLFNKRGYTYTGFELDDKDRDKLESDELRDILEEKCGAITQDSIERFLTDIASNENEFETFESKFQNIILSKKDNISQLVSKTITMAMQNDFILKYLTTTIYNGGLKNFTDKINKTFKEKSLEKEFGKSKNDELKKFVQILLDDNNVSFIEDIKLHQLSLESIAFQGIARDGLEIIEKLIQNHRNEIINGNLPRAKYFEELNQEIVQNIKIKTFFEDNDLQIFDMQNLIGNISNYQLKELRRYFNDKNMAQSDIWDDKKLHKITFRFIANWHPKDEATKARKKDALNLLGTKSIIEFLTTTNPNITIPPYDDMNNRGAVKCQTLRLNEEYINMHLQNWHEIVQKLATQKYYTNLDDCTVNGSNKDLTLLHRILDTSSKIDIYALRGKEPSEFFDIM